ncbi:MAG: T9SS type A sorting domain-containing protein [Saprospiraceae bacterium]
MFFKNIATFICLLLATASFSQQREWIGELKLNSLDCDARTVCYNLQIVSANSIDWVLGDQNYRLFFDADNASIVSVKSLLYSAYYSEATINEIQEIVGQGQEAYSPLDLIDDNLGFLDFSIVAYAKQSPALAASVSHDKFTAVAEICLEFSNEMLANSGTSSAMHLYFSRPETAGMITNQFSLVSAIDAPNHTTTTRATAYSDVAHDAGWDSQLGEVCQQLKVTDAEQGVATNKLMLSPNPFSIDRRLTYTADLSIESNHNVTIFNSLGKEVVTYQDLPAGNRQIELAKKLVKGVYLFQVKAGELYETEQLIIVE